VLAFDIPTKSRRSPRSKCAARSLRLICRQRLGGRGGGTNGAPASYGIPHGGKLLPVIAEQWQKHVVFGSFERFARCHASLNKTPVIRAVEVAAGVPREIDGGSLNSQIETQQEAFGPSLQINSGVQDFGGAGNHG